MIPLFRPSVTALEIENVTRVLESGWWGLGPETEKFEQEFAEFTGVRYAVGVNSATSALELAARACGITGKTVAVPALTFVSTAQAMQHAGNRVIFVDVDHDDLCLRWDDPVIRQADAVVPVWFGGTVIEPGLGFNDPWPQVPIIEDCAHAAGSKWAGQIGWAACWSFQAVKNLATGDGGMVTTDDPDVAQRLRALRWCGIDKSTWERDQGKYGWDYSIPLDGEKMHMNDITAALGRAQLSRLKEMNKRRLQIANAYYYDLRDLDWLEIPGHFEDYSSNHLCIVRVPAVHRNRFIDHLLSNGVSAGVHYKPLTHYPHLFPGEHSVPVTEEVWKTLVTIPLFPDMTEGEVSQVIDAIRRFPI